MFVVFFFKQKTAYEMRISDWSSDVCSSDLSSTLGVQLAGLEDQTADRQTRHFIEAAAAQYALRVAGVQCKAVETGGVGKQAQRNQMRFGETVLIDPQAHRAGLRVLQRQLHFNDAGFTRFPFGLQPLAVRTILQRPPVG